MHTQSFCSISSLKHDRNRSVQNRPSMVPHSWLSRGKELKVICGFYWVGCIKRVHPFEGLYFLIKGSMGSVCTLFKQHVCVKIRLSVSVSVCICVLLWKQCLVLDHKLSPGWPFAPFPATVPTVPDTNVENDRPPPPLCNTHTHTHT